MYEDFPEKDTPAHIRKELAEYGGLSPDGKPIWRLVLARNCRIHCFGALNHISKGRIDDITKSDDAHAKAMFEPDRVEDGEHWIPRYKSQGWILERWFPAIIWGERNKWESEKARDGRTRLLAAYPQGGAYLMMAGPWPTIEQAGDLKGAIRVYNVMQRRNPVNWGNELQRMAKSEEIERQERADEYAEEIAAQHREAISPMLHSVSLAAQEFRNIVSAQTAGGVSLTAAEKWG